MRVYDLYIFPLQNISVVCLISWLIIIIRRESNSYNLQCNVLVVYRVYTVLIDFSIVRRWIEYSTSTCKLIEHQHSFIIIYRIAPWIFIDLFLHVNDGLSLKSFFTHNEDVNVVYLVFISKFALIIKICVKIYVKILFI